ncbi:hypothetical protein MFLAVUS_006994 [Mucor flavus]|uniref:Uncharacterized protein n=1 Tax=Mucor flavus TaxID=439312 RepID=A0ABP9Z339_9FUNG
MICLDYMYNCFKNLKDSFQNYQAYASGYDAHQYVSPVNDSGQKLHYSLPIIASKKKYIVKYFCPKKTSPFDEYYVDEYDMMESDKDEKYDYVDEDDTDILSAYADEYDSDDEDYNAGVLSANEDKTEYPPARTLDNPWGFINSGNLSVEFKNTTLAPEVVDMSLMILAQAEKDYFERLVSVSKRNLSA